MGPGKRHGFAANFSIGIDVGQTRVAKYCREPRCGGCLAGEPGPGPIGGAAIERDAQYRRVVLVDLADVLDIGHLEDGLDPGEMRQLTAGEGRGSCGG
jgi:hypothetical protein